MKNTVLKFGFYGLLIGLGLFLAGLVFMKDADLSTGEIVGYTTMIASLSFVFFGIRHYKEKVNKGKISFGKAISIGMLISCFPAIGIAIADYIYTKIINPNFFEEYVEIMQSQGHTDPIPEWGSATMAFIMFLTVMILGLIISILSGLVLQTKSN
jgi:hypothetical protein